MPSITRNPLSLSLFSLLTVPLVHAAEPGNSLAAASATTLDGLTVTGAREARQSQQIGVGEIARMSPGTNPMKVLEKLPGVHFVSSDPWGSYEWSSRIAIRGFNQNQLGYTLDGVPLGDNSYANNNGLSPNRAVISENVALIDLAQGAGSLRTASTSNLGGSLLYLTRDPSLQAEAMLSQVFGTHNTVRTFFRVDSGEHNGVSAYLSGLYSDSQKWKGDGPLRQKQINSKAVYEWGDGQKLSFWLDYSSRNETDDADLSLDLIRRCGMDWDNYAGDWDRALQAAYGNFSGCVNSKDDAYFRARGLRDDYLSYLSGDFTLGEQTTLKTTAYYHRNEGQGHWFTPHISSPTIPMALRITSYDVERKGALASAVHAVGDHELEAGLWYEDGVHGGGRSFVHIDGPENDGHLYDNSRFAQRLFRQRFDTRTRQWYVQDTWKLLDDRLKLNAGFKGQDVITDATVVVPGRAGGRLRARDSFMPQLGATWALDAASDIYLARSENQAAFRPGVNGAWSLSQEAFDASRATAKPEQSRTLEAGWRTAGRYVEASVAVYAVDFKDRQLIITPCAGVVSCPNQFANVGNVTTRGAELAVVWKPIDGLRWLNSLAYNRSRYDDDYLNNSYVNPVDGSHLVPAKGKQVVDTPKQLFATELSYDIGEFNLRLAGKYTGKRYYTYTNDAGVPAFWLWDTGLSWQKEALGDRIQSLRIALDITNVFDKEYIATLGSNGFRDSDPDGTFQTLLAGSPRQAFLSVQIGF